MVVMAREARCYESSTTGNMGVLWEDEIEAAFRCPGFTGRPFQSRPDCCTTVCGFALALARCHLTQRLELARHAISGDRVCVDAEMMDSHFPYRAISGADGLCEPRCPPLCFHRVLSWNGEVIRRFLEI
jgi:hypothetical protein